jgi:hypothetical protein
MRSPFERIGFSAQARREPGRLGGETVLGPQPQIRTDKRGS